jgi:hypothetical protein
MMDNDKGGYLILLYRAVRVSGLNQIGRDNLKQVTFENNGQECTFVI